MDWQGKSVFLTGHTGFKGGWMSLLLKELGATVTGFALEPDSSPNLYSLVNLSEEIDSVIGDIRDFQCLSDALTKAAPDIVIHMAAQALVKVGYESPIETYQTNVIGTAHCLEAIRACPSVKQVLIITTDKCYENLEQDRAYKEDDALGGYDPYSSSKACTEIVSHAYRRSFLENKVALATARAGNVIGGGDFSEYRLLPDFFRSYLDQTTLAIRYPKAVRPWQHVLEPICGYVRLIEELHDKPEKAIGAWNFGPELASCQTVENVINGLNNLLDTPVAVKMEQAEQVHEATLLKLDITKAKTELNHLPKLDLQTALQWTADWYQAYQSEQNLKSLTLGQLREYRKL